MSFLNPVMLLGLAAVAAPILIHLLKRRRLQKVVWAAMRFLSASVEQHRRRMKVEDLILLAVRCLLIALIALALARPAILSSGGGPGNSGVTAIIVIDNSRSMGMSDGTSTRLEKARKVGEQVIDTLPSGSAVAVWFASDVVQAAIAEPTFDAHLARKIIRNTPLTDRPSNLAPVFQHAIDVMRQAPVSGKELYLITDGQALAWQQWTEIQKGLEAMRGLLNTHVVFINEHETRNMAVSGLALASGISPAGHPLRFQVTVANEGNAEAREVRVGIGLDGQPALDEFVIPHLPAHGSQSVSLFPKLAEPGLHAITARIPQDRLAADDQVSFVVHAIDELRVLIVGSEPDPRTRESSTFFLEHALAPVASDRTNDYFIKVATVREANLRTVRLDDYDAVIMAGVGQLDEMTARLFESFVRQGGGLLMFPGESYGSIGQLARLLPAKIGNVRGAADQDQRYSSFSARPYEHPLASLWNDPASGDLSSARFFKHLELIADNEANVVLTYADGSPAVLEHPYGEGRVMLFSSTADTSWNDWPVRPSFVPFLHRALGSIIQRQDQGLNISVGDMFNRRLDAQFLHKHAIFRPPSVAGRGRSADAHIRVSDIARGSFKDADVGIRAPIRASTDLRRVEMIDGQPAVQYKLTDSAGIYGFEIAEPPLSAKFSATASAAESSLAQISPAQLELLRSYARVSEWTPSFELKSELEKSRAGFELWLPLVLLSGMLAMSESVLAQWFSRSR